MHKIPNISKLPNKPAVYALYGGKGSHKFIAYIGIADKLRQRVSQHLIRRDSSITTGASIVSLNPDLVTEMKWWEHELFSKREYLEAAETIAFDILDPILRSRGKITGRSTELLLEEDQFRREMVSFFLNKQSGHLIFQDFQDLAKVVEKLENEIIALNKRIVNIELTIKEFKKN